MRKCKVSLPQHTFLHAKTMVLPFKNYGFTAQKLWFCISKPMLLQPKSIGFIGRHLISSFKGILFPS